MTAPKQPDNAREWTLEHNSLIATDVGMGYLLKAANGSEVFISYESLATLQPDSKTDSGSAARCAKCGHAAHPNSICYNMASDNGCECNASEAKPAAQVCDSGSDEPVVCGSERDGKLIAQRLYDSGSTKALEEIARETASKMCGSDPAYCTCGGAHNHEETTRVILAALQQVRDNKEAGSEADSWERLVHTNGRIFVERGGKIVGSVCEIEPETASVICKAVYDITTRCDAQIRALRDNKEEKMRDRCRKCGAALGWCEPDIGDKCRKPDKAWLAKVLLDVNNEIETWPEWLRAAALSSPEASK